MFAKKKKGCSIESLARPKERSASHSKAIFGGKNALDCSLSYYDYKGFLKYQMVLNEVKIKIKNQNQKSNMRQLLNSTKKR